MRGYRVLSLLMLPLFVAACGKRAEEQPPPPPPGAPGGPTPMPAPGAGGEQAEAPKVPAATPPPPMASIEGKSILFITNASSDFWNAVDKGMTDAGSELGVTVKMQRNGDGSVEGQIKLLDDALAQKDTLAGVAISVLQADAPELADKMKALIAAGIPVIAVDSDGPADARCAFVGTNNLEAGKALGEWARSRWALGYKYCTFVGTTSAQNARDRAEGFQEGAGGNFDKVDEYQDDTDFTKARSNADTALTAHAEAELLVGLWSYNGPLIAEAIEAAGKKDKVHCICFDAAENLLPLIESGAVEASAVQNPYLMGYEGVKLLKAYATGDEAVIKELLAGTDVHDTGIRIITPDTYAEFKKELDAKGLTSS